MTSVNAWHDGRRLETLVPSGAGGSTRTAEAPSRSTGAVRVVGPLPQFRPRFGSLATRGPHCGPSGRGLLRSLVRAIQRNGRASSGLAAHAGARRGEPGRPRWYAI